MIERKDLESGKTYYTSSVSFCAPREGRIMHSVGEIVTTREPMKVLYKGNGYYFTKVGGGEELWLSPSSLYGTLEECIAAYNESIQTVIDKVKEYSKVVEQAKKKRIL